MTNNFWEGGPNTYGEALETEYHAELGALRAQFKSARTESERLDIERQIARLTEVYREKSQATRRSLF
jgi:hypothetical protein